MLEFILPAAASVIGGLLSSGGTEDTNKANREIAASSNQFNAEQATINRVWSAEQAQKAMDFSERMSNTQWSRGVADMQAAGLNPMLAYSRGGASAPSGAVGSSSAASSVSPPRMENAVAAGVNSASEAYKAVSEGLRLQQDYRIRKPLETGASLVDSGLQAVQGAVAPVSQAVSELAGAVEDKLRDGSLSSAAVAQAAKFVDSVSSYALDIVDRSVSPGRELLGSTSSAQQARDRREGAVYRGATAVREYRDQLEREGRKWYTERGKVAYERKKAAEQMIHGVRGDPGFESRGRVPRSAQRRLKEYEWKFNYTP